MLQNEGSTVQCFVCKEYKIFNEKNFSFPYYNYKCIDCYNKEKGIIPKKDKKKRYCEMEETELYATMEADAIHKKEYSKTYYQTQKEKKILAKRAEEEGI